MTPDTADGIILLLGGNELNQGMVGLAAAWGCKLLVVDWNAIPAITGDGHLRIDIKDAAAIMAGLSDDLPKVRMAYTSADAAVGTVARIHESIGHPHPDMASIHAARNKVTMNDMWSAASLLSKNYRQCFSPADLEDFSLANDGTVIVKPIDASSSRGLTVLAPGAPHSDREAAFSRAAGLSSNGAVLAEEFVHGTEFTIEMIGDAYGNVEIWGVSKKYHTRNTRNNCIAVKLHYAPGDVPRETQEALARFGARCFQALGLRSSLGHLEVILKEDGSIVPVELAARSSGFIATHLLDALHDLPHGYLNRYLSVLRGERVTNGLRSANKSSMYFFYDPPPGIWKSEQKNLLSYLPRDKGITSLAGGRTRLVSGTQTGLIDSDNERLGFEILVGSPKNLTIENISASEQAMYADCVAPTGTA